MKKRVVEKIQEILMKIAITSVGKSYPAGIYERRIPKVVAEEALKVIKTEIANTLQS